jgi:4-amino-4-deoxy-L-arabinose transferase-like glycosyltransferase
VKARSWWIDLAILAAACLCIYGWGLTSHGLTNWQEAQRAQATREMQQAGNWLYPTINMQPYLAKPPVFYWCQLILAEIRSAPVGEWELRATVAIAGTLGVLATYVFGRMMFQHARPRSLATCTDDASWAREASLLSAFFLATGMLYARSSRIGELDILLAPGVVVAAGSIVMAWLRHRSPRLQDAKAGWPLGPEPPAWRWLLLACAASIITALTKGPPGLLAIAVAGYGGIVLWAAFSDDVARVDASKRSPVLPFICGAIALSLISWILLRKGKDPVVVNQLNHPLGWPLLALCGGAMAVIVWRLTERDRAVALWRAATRTYILGVIGSGAAALVIWGRLVGAAIGPDTAAAWANKEAEDNLNLLVPISPVSNLEAMSYGVGLGSLAAICGLIVLARRQPRLHGAWYVCIAWTLLGFIAFSLLGKGVARYLTPLWPGVALLGGGWCATWLAGSRGAPRSGLRRTVLLSAIVVLGGAQAWWYAVGRERFFSERSPRAIMVELLSAGVDPQRIAAYEWRNAALDYYAGVRVESVGDTRIRDVTSGGRSWTLDDLRREVESRGPFTIFVRDRVTVRNAVLPVEEIRGAGFSVTPIQTRSRFVIENGRVPMIPVRVELPDQPR